MQSLKQNYTPNLGKIGLDSFVTGKISANPVQARKIRNLSSIS